MTLTPSPADRFDGPQECPLDSRFVPRERGAGSQWLQTRPRGGFVGGFGASPRESCRPVRAAPSGARRSAHRLQGWRASESIRRLTAMGCWRVASSSAASVACEGSSASPVCSLRRAGTETRRRQVSRLQGDCSGNGAVEATAARSARNAPLPEPTVRGRARAPLERLGFSSELPSQSQVTATPIAVASRPPGRWRSVTLGCRFCGARAADVVALGVNAATSASSGPGTLTSATWMRPLLVRELRRIATVPFGWVVTHLAGCLPGQRPCTGALLEAFGFRGCRSPTGAALNKCLAARPVVPRRVNDLLLGIRPAGWIARSATASAACQLFGVLRGAPRGLRSHPGLKFLQLSSVVPARGSQCLSGGVGLRRESVVEPRQHEDSVL